MTKDTLSITKKGNNMNIKITEVQKERLLKGINNLKELNNDIRDSIPLEYHKLIELDGLEYFLSEVFKLELPKCEHNYANRYRDYRFIKREKKNA